ncbi:hypothetical protein [Paraburkholderia sacchari]|uniref:hypothetical protein n=1 Tax=Paraburkholderia sacchari TaxID=159450 RepID=UPI001BCB55FA|nr:hypothetical protein [Paraburkholderia sacchari]
MNGGILASGTLPDAFAPGGKIWGISMKRGLGSTQFPQRESLSFSPHRVAPDFETSRQWSIPGKMFINDSTIILSIAFLV